MFKSWKWWAAVRQVSRSRDAVLEGQLLRRRQDVAEVAQAALGHLLAGLVQHGRCDVHGQHVVGVGGNGKGGEPGARPNVAGQGVPAPGGPVLDKLKALPGAVDNALGVEAGLPPELLLGGDLRRKVMLG